MYYSLSYISISYFNLVNKWPARGMFVSFIFILPIFVSHLKHLNGYAARCLRWYALELFKYFISCIYLLLTIYFWLISSSREYIYTSILDNIIFRIIHNSHHHAKWPFSNKKWLVLLLCTINLIFCSWMQKYHVISVYIKLIHIQTNT